MNRSVICGVAGLAMLVAVALATSENTATAGHFNRCGGGGGLFGGHGHHNNCGGGLFGHHRGKRGGGLFSHHRNRNNCCAPVYVEPCCEPAPVCCEPAPQPCCQPAPQPCCEPAPQPCCGAVAPVVQSGCCGGSSIGGQVIYPQGDTVIQGEGVNPSASDVPPQPQAEVEAEAAAPAAPAAPAAGAEAAAEAAPEA